jgi:hypothetical protein
MILIKFGIGEFTPQVVKEIQFWFVTVWTAINFIF